MDNTEYKNRKLELSEERLEAQQRHIALQEEKTRLLKEKRAKEKAEARIKEIKRLFSLYYVKKAANVAKNIAVAMASLVGILAALAQFNPDARELYFVIINKLNKLITLIVRGASISVSKVDSMFSSILKLIRRKSKHDSRAIRHSDLIGTLTFASVFTTVILPLLGKVLFAGAVGAVSSSVKENVVNPIIKRLISHGKDLVRNKDKDSTYTDAIIKGINTDMGKLKNVLGREKDSLVTKIFSSYDRIKRLA